jgi:hypothetical protein
MTINRAVFIFRAVLTAQALSLFAYASYVTAVN